MFHLIVQPVITGQMLSRGGQRTLCILMLHVKGSMKEPNMFRNCETEKKITHKASDAAENLQLYCCSVLPPEIVTHDAFNVINVKNCSLSTTYNGEITHRKQQK